MNVEVIGAFFGGAVLAIFAVFILTRIASKKYDVVERPPGDVKPRPGDTKIK